MEDKLWCDLKTDMERVEFLRSGQAVSTGIIAQAITEDVALAFEFRMRAAQPVAEPDVCPNCAADDDNVHVWEQGDVTCNACGKAR